MGVGLTEITQVLAGDSNEIAAQRLQRQQILAERDRLHAIVETIERTVGDLTANRHMDPEDFFRGLHQDRSHLRKQLEHRLGPDADGVFIAAEAATDGWEVTDYELEATRSRELLRRMADLMHHGTIPTDANAQRLIDEHHNSIVRFWVPNKASYSALADLYLNDDQQHSWIASVDPALPPWLATAMKTHASRLPSGNFDS